MEIIQPHDIVVIARTAIASAKYKDIEAAVVGLFRKAGLTS
jgi:hypothetical protein